MTDTGPDTARSAPLAGLAPDAHLVLGIETSCDETAAAVVRDGSVQLSSVISSQVDKHARYGGVVPEIASRAHVEMLNPVIAEAVVQAGVADQEIDAVGRHLDGGHLLVHVSRGLVDRRTAVDGRTSLYDREQLDQLSGFVEVGRCAAVRDHELTAMWRASEAFEAKQGLKEAAEYLTAWVARSVAVHELRHVSDDMQYDDDDDKRPCGPCVSSDPKVVRSEAAAYVAELAWTKAPAAALYQICVATAGGQGAHARAREVVMQGLRSNCSDGVPPEITEAARTLEAEAFDHPEPIDLGEGFVARLPVVSARDQGVAGTEEP